MKDFFAGTKPVVCFFDSGIGGLPFLYESAKRLPSYRFLYFADNYNMPYGKLLHNDLLHVSDSFFTKINEYEPSAAVIACNTVTAHCAAFLRAKYCFPIIGVQPAVKPAAKGAEKCVVLATVATTKSAPLKALVDTYGGNVTEVFSCPDLAEYIERNVFDLDEATVTSMLPEINADRVVLGCTHYIYVKKIISRFYDCPVYDGVDGTVNRLCGLLALKEREPNPQKPQIEFVCGDTDKNKQVFERVVCGI